MKFLHLFTRNWDEMLSAYLLSNIIYRRPKAYKLKLEISGPGLRFIVIYMRTSDRYESFSSRSNNGDEVRPVSCNCQKRNVWRQITHACLSSSRCPSEFRPLWIWTHGGLNPLGFSPLSRIWTPHITAYLFNCLGDT